MRSRDSGSGPGIQRFFSSRRTEPRTRCCSSDVGRATRSEIPEDEQDEIIAVLLRRLWREPTEGHRFRPLSLMIDHWCVEIRQAALLWTDKVLVAEGLAVLGGLANSRQDQVLLATDLHAGNVLHARRLPWLAIDSG